MSRTLSWSEVNGRLLEVVREVRAYGGEIGSRLATAFPGLRVVSQV